MTGDSALDQQQATLDVDAEHGEVLGRDDFRAVVAGHLLALERLARILTLTGRTVRTVRDRDAVGRPQAAEVPALHGAGEALADGLGLDVDLLAGDEMVSRELGAHIHHGVRIDAELGDIGLGFHFKLGERFALSLVGVLGLFGASTQLQGDVAVPLLSPLTHDLTAIQLQDRDWDMRAVFSEDTRHTQFLGDHARAHRIPPLSY